MKPEQENLHFEDIAQTLRSAEFRRADDISRLLRQFFRSRWLRRVVARGELGQIIRGFVDSPPYFIVLISAFDFRHANRRGRFQR